MSRDTPDRFVEAQEHSYEAALGEIRRGRKVSHWMWYIFPQIDGLGMSPTAKFYSIRDIEEAEEYLAHPVLGERLIRITSVVNELKGRTAEEIFGYPDVLKFRSCMTLFSCVKNAPPVFEEALKKYFRGEKDERTLGIIGMKG